METAMKAHSKQIKKKIPKMKFRKFGKELLFIPHLLPKSQDNLHLVKELSFGSFSIKIAILQFLLL
jgi:hypothetical protein